MPEDNSREHEEQKGRQRSSQFQQDMERGAGASEAQEGHSPHSISLLGDLRLGARGNTGVRAEVARQAQQTHGNRAVQRVIQRAASSAPEAVEEDEVARRIEEKAGGGSPIDGGIRSHLEQGLGADLSSVRVHTDDEADKLARSVSSTAFTSGQDIFFRSGVYNPHDSEGLKLLAHEATHTVQQSQGPVDGTPSEGGVSISDPSDKFEKAAEEAAERVAAGKAAAASPGQANPPAQRLIDEEDNDSVQRSIDPAAYA